MDRLIINPASEAAWEAPLRPGRNCVGRAADCDVVVDHLSVAFQHAEIEVSPGHVVLRDLSSDRGTWFQGERVTEMNLEPGLEFSLGEVTVCFDGEPRSPTSAPVEAEAEAAPVKLHLCRHHPQEVARWHCPRCQRDFCEACVNVHTGGHLSNHFCRACGGECQPLAVPLTYLPGAPEAESGFWNLLPRAFGYPFQGNGPILLVAGTVFLLFVRLVASAAGGAVLVGGAALLIITVFAGGYTFSYCKRIIEATASGEDAPPDWPDFNDLFEDALQPFLQLLALLAMVFGPAILVSFVSLPSLWMTGLLELLFLGLGVVLAPMALLALTMYDRVLALNPALLVPSILRCPVHYFATAGLFLGALGAYAGVDFVLAWLLPIPYLPALVATALSLYFLLVAMRVLGVFYRANREPLGWLK